MTRALVLGDTHGNVPFLERAARMALRSDCDRILQVGDWGYLWPGKKNERRLEAANNVLAQFGIEMFFLDGNHEWYGKLEELGASPNAPTWVQLAERITYLPRAFTWTWDDVSFMSLGGAYSIDQSDRTKFIDYWPEEVISYSQAERAIEVGHVDVMLTHDAPQGMTKLEEMLRRTSDFWRHRYGAKWNYKLDPGSRANRAVLREVVDAVQPLMLIHGHYHWRYDEKLVGDGYETLVRGLNCDGTGAESWGVLDTAEVKELRGG